MIKIKDWVAQIPDEDRYLAYVGEDSSVFREFQILDPNYNSYDFFLDMAFDLSSVSFNQVTEQEVTENNSSETMTETSASKNSRSVKERRTVTETEVDCLARTDIAPLKKIISDSGPILQWTVLAQHTQLPGRLDVTIRGVSQTGAVKKSAIMHFFVEPAVAATPAQPVSKTEFEQMEMQFIEQATGMLDEMSALADDVKSNADRTENCAASSCDYVTQKAAEAALSAKEAADCINQALAYSTDAKDSAEEALKSEQRATAAASHANQYVAVAAQHASEAAVRATAAAESQAAANDSRSIAVQKANEAEEYAIAAANSANAAADFAASCDIAEIGFEKKPISVEMYKPSYALNGQWIDFFGAIWAKESSIIVEMPLGDANKLTITQSAGKIGSMVFYIPESIGENASIRPDGRCHGEPSDTNTVLCTDRYANVNYEEDGYKVTVEILDPLVTKVAWYVVNPDNQLALSDDNRNYWGSHTEAEFQEICSAENISVIAEDVMRYVLPKERVHGLAELEAHVDENNRRQTAALKNVEQGLANCSPAIICDTCQSKLLAAKATAKQPPLKLTISGGESEKSNPSMKVYGKNILPQCPRGTWTQNGVTFIANSDGSVTVNGTAADSVWGNLLVSGFSNTLSLPAGTYTLSGCPADGADSKYKMVFGAGHTYSDYGNGITREIAEDMVTSVYIYICKGYTANNLIFHPQIEVGDAKTSYAQYMEPQRVTLNGISLATGDTVTVQKGTVTAQIGDVTEDISNTANGQALLALQANKPTTTVMADVPVQMTYVADTKAYIDSILGVC